MGTLGSSAWDNDIAVGYVDKVLRSKTRSTLDAISLRSQITAIKAIVA